MTKELVVYYSHSGNTKKGAMLISKVTGADVLELVPERAYPKGMWATVDEFKKELAGDLRRAILPYDVDVSQYDTIYIGTPNWGDTLATPLRSFFDKEDLADKRIMPFVTHGGGGLGNCSRDMIRLSGTKNYTEPLVYSGGSVNERKVKEWLQKK